MPSHASHDLGPGRIKTLKSCDICRQKKLKCDGDRPSCRYCISHEHHCQYTGTRKQRRVRTEKVTNTLQKAQAFNRYLEGRLARLESRLAVFERGQDKEIQEDDFERFTNDVGSQLGPFHKDVLEQSDTALDSDGSNSRANSEDLHTRANSVARQAIEQEDLDQVTNKMASLLTTERGETRYIGSSSGFSIFSPQAVKWANSKIGDTSFEQILQESVRSANQMVYWSPERFGDLFLRRVFMPLPPMTEAQSLVREYFANFNCVYPLFDELTFMHLLSSQYSSEPCEGSGWWACLNATLAIAYRLRVQNSDIPEEEDRKASQYLKNSLGVLTELTMKNLDVMSVQALLAISLFMQGTPNPIPCTFLVSAAIRLSHSMGLHRRDISNSLRPREVEQRKRIFWIAYIIDKEICIRYGRPPVQDDDDTDVDLPLENPVDGVGSINLKCGATVNFFRLSVTFARIQSRVYKLLYSVKAEKQSSSELLKTVEELDKELEEWKDEIPLDIRPSHKIQTSHSAKLTHIVALHLSYFNCLAAIHRISAHYGYWSGRISKHVRERAKDTSNPRIKVSASLCASAARSTIELLDFIPHGDGVCVWLILYYPFSAVVTLFANILHNPRGVQAAGDLELIHTACTFLLALNADDNSGAFTQLLKICLGFEKIATRLIENTPTPNSIMNTTQQQVHIQAHEAEDEQDRDLRQESSFDQGFTTLGLLLEEDPSLERPLMGADADMQDFYESIRMQSDQNSFQESTTSQYWEIPMIEGWGLADMSGMFYSELLPQVDADAGADADAF